ncbi:MAG: hypothetical protein L0154_04055 [Chloroflexi bacterium]|nr:hypothetical protein [Chloroflexota bacterium]
MQYRIFTFLLAMLFLLVHSLPGHAQSDELPPAPDAELESVILFPDALFQGELSPDKSDVRFVLYAEEGDTVNVDLQRLGGSPGTQATLFDENGQEVKTASAEELENLILQFDAPVSGWYGLEIAVNAAIPSQFQMLLTGTSQMVYSLLEELPEELNAIVLFAPATVRGGDYLVFVPASRMLEVSGDNITVSDMDGNPISGGNPAFSPETGQWVHISSSGEFGVAFTEGGGLTPRDFLPVPPNIVVDGAILEVTLFGDPLDALSSASPGAGVAATLHWGDRVLHQGNKVNIGGRIYLEVTLPNGSTAYIPEGAELYIERDPNIVTEGVEVGAVIAVTRDGAFSTLYSDSSATSDFVEELQAGYQLTIVDGPIYSEYAVWWQIQMADGRIGWAPDIPGWWRLFTPAPGN